MRFAVLGSEAERRDGLKALLRQINRHARFCEARDWAQACRALRRMPVDLLVVDWHDAMRVSEVRVLFAEQRGLRMAMIVDDASPCRVHPLMDEGVQGVIPRPTNPKLIVRLLELVLVGGHYAPHGAFLREGRMTPDVSPPPSLVCELAPPSARRARLAPALSPRQEQIMRCVHMGSTNKMIARTLGISEGTVKIHLASIFQQLGAPNRAAAVAIYNGWLTPQLEVLRPESEPARAPHPTDQSRSAPLCPSTPFTYPLPHPEETNNLLMAAEPDVPFCKVISNPGSR
jgi:DNA-binding NarL/FixJ family response regulator